MPTGVPRAGRGDLAFTSREKRAAAGVVLALLLLGVLWMGGSTSVQRSDLCRTCLTSRTTRQWGLGTLDGDPFLAAGTEFEMRPSDLLHLLSPGHEHDWRRWTTTTHLLGSRRSIACNTRDRNPLAARFADRHPFRLFLEGRRSDGVLLREELIALTALPGDPSPEWLADPARRALLERAQALLVQGDGEGDPGWTRALARGR